MSEVLTAICIGCGNTFEYIPKGSGRFRFHKYCSTTCYRQKIANSFSAPCPICKKQFIRPASHHRIYCSKVCHNKAMERKIEKICPICQKPFRIPASYVNRFIVCSMKCRLTFTRYHNCDFCGKHFTIRPHKIRFCSLSCYRRYHGETSIEKTTRQFLDRLQLPYQQEAKIGRYAVDFFIPSLNLVVECDGAYWHRNKRRDIAKNHFLKLNSYRLLRLSEDSIKSGEATNLIFAHTNNHNLHLFK